jgi:hypothetical protein
MHLARDRSPRSRALLNLDPRVICLSPTLNHVPANTRYNCDSTVS